MIERGFPLEVEHGVDDVLERLRSRNTPALGDVPDEQYRGPRFLGEPHQPGGALAHLADVAGSALELFSVSRLHRVEEDDARFQLRGVMQNGFEARLAEDVDAPCILLQAIGAQPQLVRRLLARDIQRHNALALEPCGALHEERGLANAGLAAHQDDGSGDDSAAEDEVEFGEAGFPAINGRLLQVG